MARSYENPAPGPLGTTFTGAAGQSDNKLYINANGQFIPKASNPDLAGLYPDQTIEQVGNLVDFTTNGQMPNFQINTTYSFKYDSTATYSVYAEEVQWANYDNGTVFWSTTDGQRWRLVDCVFGNIVPQKVVAIGTDIFVCTNNGLYRTLDGLSFTKVRESGNISDICFDGTTYFIVFDGLATHLSTTDFITYSSVTTPVAIYGALFFNGNFWAFDSSTTIRYSSDLITWTSAPILLTGASIVNQQKVVNGLMFVCRNTNGQAIALYNSDPLLNSWSSTGQLFSSSHGRVTNIIYDSGLSQYIFPVLRTSGIFGYVVTNLATSGTSIDVGSSTVPSNNDSMALKYGSNCIWQLSPHYGLSSTTWLTGTRTPTDSNAIQNPFFSSTNPRAGSGGVTDLGSRWLAKPIGSTSSTVYQSYMIEINGVFEELRTSATNAWPFSTSSTGQHWNLVYEDAAGYCVMAGNNNTGNFYYSSFNSSRLRVSNSTVTGTPAGSSHIFCPVKNLGIIALQSSSGISSRQIYLLTTNNPNAPSLVASYNLLNSTSNIRQFHYSRATGEITILEQDSGTPAQTNINIIKNNQLVGRSIINLYSSTGAIVSVNTSITFARFGNVYYAVQGGAALYRSIDGANFYEVVPGVALIALNLNSMVETSPGVVLASGRRYSVSNGTLLTTSINATVQSVLEGPIPVLFPCTNKLAFEGYQLGSGSFGGVRFSSPEDVTENFRVPAIPSNVSGQSTYIVAR